MDARHGGRVMSARTWYVPPVRRAAWETLPARTLSFGEKLTLSFPGPRLAELEVLVHDLVSAPRFERGPEAVRGVSARLLDPSSAERRQALDLLVAVTGRARAMIESSFDHLFGEWTKAPGLEAFPASTTRRLVTPHLVYHVLAANVPWAGVDSLFAATMAGSASLVKLSTREPVLAGLVAQLLAEEDPALSATLAVLHWPGGDHALEEAVLAEADAVVAFGDNATVAGYAARLAHRIAAGRVLFVPRGHRLSVAVLGPGVLAEKRAMADACRALALDLAYEDQEGCLSPSGIYLVSEGAAPDAFAAQLAEELGTRESEWPRRSLSEAEAASVQQARLAAEWAGARVLGPRDSTAWTVIVDESGSFVPAPQARFARLRVVDTMSRAIEELAPARGALSTVGIAGFGDEAAAVTALAALAPGRICALGHMQRPRSEERRVGKEGGARG